MVGADVAEDAFAAALEGGDVASVILSPVSSDDERLDEAAFLARAKALVPVAQAMGTAAIVAFEPRVAARAGADGVHLDGIHGEADIERLHHEMSVGIGNLNDRHGALAAGERPIDYVFFGRLQRDMRPDPHPRNLKLAQWWSEIVTLPCIVSAGSQMDSLVPAARTGADFVALQKAIFAAHDPAEAVARANALLDEHAPVFDG